MTTTGSISHWIGQLKDGDQRAAEELWQRYFERLVTLARKKLGGQRRAADEEDVALEAFHSLCRGADRGCFTQLSDRDDLWKLLVVITIRKAVDHVQHATRAKRGGGKVRGESCLADSQIGGLAEALAREPGPDIETEFGEQYRHLMERLGDDTLRAVAQYKMEGYTNEDIAQKLGCVPRTVERKLQVIRVIWSDWDEAHE